MVEPAEEVTPRPKKLESMRIVTGCKTPEQFVAAFYRFCDSKTCFIPSSDQRPVGSALAFSLRLADGTPMLRGTCIVKAAWSTADNIYKRAGVQLEIRKLTAESELVFEQLLSQKTVVAPKPAQLVASAPSDGVVEEVAAATTNQHVPRDKAIDLILKQGNAPVVAIKKPRPLPGASEAKAAPSASEAKTTNDASAPAVDAAGEPSASDVKAAPNASEVKAAPSASEIKTTNDPSAPTVDAASEPSASEVKAAGEPSASDVKAAPSASEAKAAPNASEIKPTNDPSAPAVDAASEPSASVVDTAGEPSASEIKPTNDPSAPAVEAANEPSASEVKPAGEPSASEVKPATDATQPVAVASDGPKVDTLAPTVELPQLELATPTVEMPPLQYKLETRAAGSALVLPANPLTDLDDSALDEFLSCTMAEDNEGAAVEDDLAIPVAEPAPFAPAQEAPAAPGREAIKTILGVAPITAVRDTQKQPAIPKPVGDDGTRPLALESRAPAPSRSLFTLHAMTDNERFWFLCAIGSALLVAAIVLASAYFFG